MAAILTAQVPAVTLSARRVLFEGVRAGGGRDVDASPRDSEPVAAIPRDDSEGSASAEDLPF
jgi:hypothetical protein